jgi:transcriptional regulator with XRE-family HTH domain
MNDAKALLARVRSRSRLPEPRERRLVRELAQVSQEDIATTLGVTRSAVSRWEAGRRSPSDDVLEAYVDLLHRLAAAR